MPCAVCDGTVQNIGVKDQRVFWCPTCGSITNEHGNGQKFCEPPTVTRLTIMDTEDEIKIRQFRLDMRYRYLQAKEVRPAEIVVDRDKRAG
jgi:hypothetical protein